MVSELEINMCNAKLFWQNIKKLESEAGLTSNISKVIWHDHFSNVFNTHFNVLTEIDGLYNIFQQYPLMYQFEKSKKGKAAGPDGLVAEMFLSSSHIVVPYFLKLFNCIFSGGVFPELWSKAVIIQNYGV